MLLGSVTIIGRSIPDSVLRCRKLPASFFLLATGFALAVEESPDLIRAGHEPDSRRVRGRVAVSLSEIAHDRGMRERSAVRWSSANRA